MAGCPTVAPGGRGSTCPWGCSFLVVGVFRLVSRREGLQACDGDGELACPGPSFGEAEPQAAAAAHEPTGDAEQPKAQAFRFPAAGLAGQGDHLRPGEQLAG
jgi:hypothetical protein